jgi:outer membrane protein OmpA-like peptidoglycan-associated protein
MADTPIRARRLGMALLAGLAAGGGMFGFAPEAASQTVTIGRSEPNVVVDLGVLDSLGPAPTLPQMLRGREPRRVTLHPPTGRLAAPAPATRQPTRPSAPASPQPLASAPAPAPARQQAAAPVPPPPVPSAPPPPPVAAPAPTANSAPPVPPSAPVPVAMAAPAAAPAPAAPPPPPAPRAAPPPPPPAAATIAPPVPPRSAAAPAPAAPAPQAALPQTASRPPAAPAAAPAGGTASRLVFVPGSADLPAGGDATLRDLAKRLGGDEGMRLQVVAYADGTPDQASQARRLSLSRALTVRSYLIGQGVRSTRIDVRALGTQASDGPADRVDLIIGDR